MSQVSKETRDKLSKFILSKSTYEEIQKNRNFLTKDTREKLHNTREKLKDYLEKTNENNIDTGELVIKYDYQPSYKSVGVNDLKKIVTGITYDMFKEQWIKLLNEIKGTRKLKRKRNIKGNDSQKIVCMTFTSLISANIMKRVKRLKLNEKKTSNSSDIINLTGNENLGKSDSAKLESFINTLSGESIHEKDLVSENEKIINDSVVNKFAKVIPTEVSEVSSKDLSTKKSTKTNNQQVNVEPEITKMAKDILNLQKKIKEINSSTEKDLLQAKKCKDHYNKSLSTDPHFNQIQDPLTTEMNGQRFCIKKKDKKKSKKFTKKKIESVIDEFTNNLPINETQLPTEKEFMKWKTQLLDFIDANYTQEENSAVIKMKKLKSM